MKTVSFTDFRKKTSGNLSSLKTSIHSSLRPILCHSVTLLLCLCATTVFADTKPPEMWGLAIGIRSASIPYAADKDIVNDIIPLMYYHGERFNLNGTSSWYILMKKKHWQFNALARFRFLDIPDDLQNDNQGHSLDYGGQIKFLPASNLDIDLELMIDQRGKYHAASYVNLTYETGRWEFLPFGRLRWKSSDFNNTYYGLGIDTPGHGFDFKLGSDIRFHLYQNLYMIGRAAVTILDDRTTDIDIVEDRYQTEFFLGMGFFSDKTKKPPSHLKSKPYLRLAHGWASESSLQEIITFQSVPDEENNQLTSLFYGHPIADTLFTLPLSIYLTPGLVFHQYSSVQDPFFEYVLAIKAYYTFKWPFQWRFGVAEGLSYSSEISYIEEVDLEGKGFEPSNTLNYLDFSLDINIGDLFSAERFKDLWIGYGIHHRSGVYETSSAFGRVSGGSNYNTVYLQYHF